MKKVATFLLPLGAIIIIGIGLVIATSPGISEVQTPQSYVRIVDLDTPGSMETLARENPDHYAKVRRIVEEIPLRPPDTVPLWLKTEFGADEAIFVGLLKTSNPAKRTLSFRLENTRYEAVFTEVSRWPDASR